MNSIEIWGWKKKTRTMIRNIKPGDIFCFTQDNKTYHFGRIISNSVIGHIAEIFNFSALNPNITPQYINSARHRLPLLVLDTYLLFDKKLDKSADWRIIGQQKNYVPIEHKNTYFVYGCEDNWKKIDVFHNQCDIPNSEVKKHPSLYPHNNFKIFKLLNNSTKNI